jgi:hypothetical protein
MRAWLYRFMTGRYGRDQFGIFLLISSYILLFASLFTGTVLTPILYYIGIIGIFYCIFRMLSRNIYKRRSENNKFLKIKNNVTGWFRRKKNRIKNSRTHRFFPCPQCGVTVRVPKGKGRIEIRCPKCGKTFIKKS